MEKTTYEDYKYCIQDAAGIYLGVKYTFQELLDNEEINFKLRLVINKYILPEADAQDTFESHLYYLEPASFLVKIYERLKARVKVNVIEERKGKRKYVTKTLTMKELTKISVENKQKEGLVIQEVRFSKLALLGV